MTKQEETVALSKTQIKKQMDELQDLGVKLTKLSDELLRKMDLPEDLFLAVLQSKKINSNSAQKRQLQYIGRLMREIDTQPIEEFLFRLSGADVAYNAFLQRIEQWRERLIESDQTVSQFVEKYPQVDVAQMRTLIRNARKEKEQSKPPKAFRALFQLLRTTLETSQNETNGSNQER